MQIDTDAQPKAPGRTGSAKRGYRPPCLVLYGDVRVLTQAGGSLTPSEIGNNPTSCSNGPNGAGHTKPCVPSDRRLKENVVQVGVHPWGFGLFLFDYRQACRPGLPSGRQFGVMADEVEPVVPEAVRTDAEGFKMVDYGLLGIRGTLH